MRPCSPSLRRAGSLKVLLIIFFVMVLVCAGLVTLAIMNGRSLLAWMVSKPLNTLVQQCSLPADQKTRLAVSLDGLIADFEKKRVSIAELSAIFQELAEEPFIDLVLLEIVRNEATQSGHFSDQELADLSLSLDRLQRGIIEGSLDSDAVKATMDCVSTAQPDGGRELKQPVMRADIKKLMAEATKQADRAGIPRERYQADIAGEVKRVIDRQLGKAASTAPAVSSAPPSLQPIEAPKPPLTPAPPPSTTTSNAMTEIPVAVPVPVAPPPAVAISEPPAPVTPFPAPVPPAAEPVPAPAQPPPAQPSEPQPTASAGSPKLAEPQTAPSTSPASQVVKPATTLASAPETQPSAVIPVHAEPPMTGPASAPELPQTAPVPLQPSSPPAGPPAAAPASQPLPVPTTGLAPRPTESAPAMATQPLPALAAPPAGPAPVPQTHPGQ
ncbi:MAG: hypothetical protein ACUVXJ_06875 [Phycisphaerae bacterium]